MIVCETYSSYSNYKMYTSRNPFYRKIIVPMYKKYETQLNPNYIGIALLYYIIGNDHVLSN